MGTVNPNKAGLVLGTLYGGWHLVWATLVAFGWAQAVINFVFWMHFIMPPFVIKPFRAEVAAILIVVTAILGYVMGYVLGALWNWIHK